MWGVPQEDADEKREGEPVGRAGVPRRVRQEPAEDLRDLRLRGRAGGGVRRPRGALPQGRGGDGRREEGPRGTGDDRGPSPGEGGQARVRSAQAPRRGRARVLVAGRARGRGGHPQRDARPQGRVRPQRGAEAAGVRAAGGSGLQARRPLQQGQALLPLRADRRRRLPGADRARPRLRAHRGRLQQGDRAQRRARRVARLLRRHQLLLRVRPRRGRRAEAEGGVEGAQAQPHRADGAAAGRGGRAHLLRPLRGQHERLRDAAAGAGEAEGARPGPGRRGRRQGHELLGQHSRLRRGGATASCSRSRCGAPGRTPS